MRRIAIAIATALLVACPGRHADGPQPPAIDDRPLRIRIAQLEVKRGAAVDELADLAVHGTKSERVLALRALGRIGGKRATDTLRTVLADDDGELSSRAAAALGIAGALDDESLLTARDVARLPRDPEQAALVFEALGRTGDASTQDTLAAALVGPPRIAEAAALGLGRFGRRKIALAPEPRAQLQKALDHADATVRYAATWAFAREHLPDGTVTSAELVAALARRIPDAQPEIRAQAIAALAKHKRVGDARAAVEESLRDRDWRVAVEAVRALAGEAGDDAGRDAVAAILIRRFTELERGDAIEEHVILEGLRALAAHGNRPLVSTALAAFTTHVATSTASSPLTRGWMECLATAALARVDGRYGEVVACSKGGLPDHLRLPLLADMITANAGELQARREALAQLLGHKDPRVRAAGLTALPAMYKAGDESDRRTAMSTIIGALSASDPVVAGTAVDAATALYEAIGTGDHEALDAALIARARRETDPELSSGLFELIGKRTLAKGAVACRAGLGGHPVRDKAAAACLAALGEPPPAPPALIAGTPPPVDITQVIGRELRWHLTTSRGDIVIRLRPDVAPWAVATIVALTRKGFYDGIEFHRVVPNFVVQGGDPTQSGWGGPNFTTPAEPAIGVETAGYIAGGVGIADAGRDSGGSQWFIMHSRAPHLDGRYTWIGSVESGQKSADALVIGDRVIQATIETPP